MPALAYPLRRSTTQPAAVETLAFVGVLDVAIGARVGRFHCSQVATPARRGTCGRHDVELGAGRVGIVFTSGVAGPALAEERDRAGDEAPARIGTAERVGPVPDAQMVIGLADEAQRLDTGRLVTVELERRSAGHEQALGGRGDEGGEVGEQVLLAERGVPAVGA